ncbi:HAD-IA family hydrolase [Scytonema sp. UIC 10036]|uniref:HAD family hydrolase n=1 Tax=Scytonema sp. UIC 10036 TaxID=2304196 RepID=UPI0012DA6552|nr:HAD family hydrolase [Scytonema sp. UIC 10036]MUG92456.1 HAD-IA family hydrolase [Scytonema sp. UIC 10036]
MNNTKVLVFDLDDTLFPEHEFVLSGFQAVNDWVQSKYAIFNFFDVAWKLFEEGRRDKIFDLTLDALEIKYEPSLIQELVQVYRGHKPTICLYQDAQWAIDYFKVEKQLGLITNGFLKTQQNKVKALRIESSFNEIVYCDVYGYKNWKPSPVPYKKMMEFTGCEGVEYMYIGDHPYKDFVAAKNLGWLTLRICRKDGEYGNIIAEENHDAHFKIRSLYELKDFC